MIYAIDFGTTNSLLAGSHNGKVLNPIPLEAGALDPTVLRTLLYFPSMKEVFYGKQAVEEFIRNEMHGRFLRSIKKHLPVRTFVGTWIEDRPVNLEDLIGFFLREMRVRANKYFDQDVDRVVLGRPARFSQDDTDDQYAQYRLERAAKKAGFNHIEFIPEPVAAACEFRSTLSEPKTVLVGDFGGGTSDFTVIRLSKKPFHASDVLSMGGVSVAGDVLDGVIMRHKISPHFGADVQYQVPFGSNILTMPKALVEGICSPADITLLGKRETMEFFKSVRQWSLGEKDKQKVDRLFCLIEDQLGFSVFDEIERVKRGLSESQKEVFRFRYPDVDIDQPISRNEFEELAQEKLEKITHALDETLSRAGIKGESVDLVCLTGGTAQVPAIRNEFVRRFGEEKLRDHKHFHSVVQGLAERAAEIERTGG